MKKTSVIAIDLKFMRIPLLISSFTAVIFVCTILCKNLPPVNLSRECVNILFSSNNVFDTYKPSHTEVFSLIQPQDFTVALSLKSHSVPSPTQTEDVKIPQTKPTASKTNAKVEISNSTNHDINISEYLTDTPAFLKENFSVLIVHTHTTESYTPSSQYDYTPTDTDRTTDKNYNMARVGTEIESVLREKGIKVYHDTTINDYPSYNGSYNRSAANTENHIKNDPSIKIVLDVHRDAIEGKNGEKIKHSTVIDGKSAAKIMLVTGSDLSGLKHDNWDENLRFASQLQKHILTLYPDLCRPINFRSQRFNQQLAPGAIIVEVGTNGNTLDEALLGAHYFAEGLADFITSQKSD